MAFEKFAVVIPASEHNQYSREGDLAKFGNTSLLEWKLDQLRSIVSEKAIFVTTASDRIRETAEGFGVRVLRRNTGLSLSEVVSQSVKDLDFAHIVWANVTSPFFAPADFTKMLGLYEERVVAGGQFDSVISVEILHEYFLYQNKPLNFDAEGLQSRRDLAPLIRITNGCAVSSKETCLKTGRYFGNKPYLHEVGRLAAFEIKDFEVLYMASDLISMYFRQILSV